MFEKLILLWLAAAPLMGSAGPATLSVAGVGAAFGLRRGLRYFLGVVLGTAGALVAVATGVTALLLAAPALAAALTIAAALYILYLAWKIATAPVGAALARETPPRFVVGLALALANPKAFAAFGALFAGHPLLPDDPAADAVLKVAALTLVILVSCSAWLAFGAAFARVLGDPVVGRWINRLFAVMLIASVALSLWRGFQAAP